MPRSASESTLTRGQILQGSGILVGTIAASSVLAAFAPTRVWALELHTLSQAQGGTLLAFARVLYPHKTLPTAVYALVVKDLDDEATHDAQAAALLRSGCASLDAAAGRTYGAASAAKRLAAARHIEGSPFFAKVRATCISSLYNNAMAFAHFGYQGSSWQYGGYIRRGFNDLTWLPNPPSSASPQAWLR